MLPLNPRTTALFVVDMQNDFIEPGAIIQVPAIYPRLKVCRTFIDWCREQGMRVVFTQHTYDPKKNPIETELFPELLKTGLRKGTHGHDIHAALDPQAKDLVMDKTRYDAFYKTRLDAWLKARHMTDVVIMGTMTNVCCESTARSAMYRDYRVWFLSDLNFTFDPKKHAYTLKTIASHFGTVLSSKELGERLR